PVSAFLDQLPHIAHSLYGGIVVGMDIGRTQRFGLGDCACRQGQGTERGHGGALEGKAQHCLPPDWEYVVDSTLVEIAAGTALVPVWAWVAARLLGHLGG